MTKWIHNELIADLESHIQRTGVNGSRMVWSDIPMGKGGSQRPDLFSLEKSFSKPNPTAYEIKVSRSDFLSDVTAGKWTGYFEFASRVIFCVPQGLVKKAEIPDKAGLMVRGPNGWKTTKKATVSGQKPGFDHMMRLLLVADGKARERDRQLDIDFYKINDQIKKKHGEKIAQIIANVDTAEHKIKKAERDAQRIINRAKIIEKSAERYAKEERDRIMADYDDAISEAKEALGLPDDINRFRVLSEIRRIARVLDSTEYEKAGILQKLIGISSRMTAELEQAVDSLGSINKKAIESLNSEPETIA